MMITSLCILAFGALVMINDEKLKTLQEIVSRQAEDYGLWFCAKYTSEQYLQRALRKLHSMIEDLENE